MKVPMFRKVCAALALMMAVPIFCQVEPGAEGDDFIAPTSETRMIPPPAVSGATLPLDSETGGRSNYLSGGVTVSSAYVGNVQPGQNSKAVNDESYSIWPVLAIDQKTPRSARSLVYSSGFTFFRRTSVLDSINQSMDAKVDYALSPRFTMSLRDSFLQNSNVFNQPFVTAGGTTSAPQGNASSSLVIPFAEELKNDANALFSLQFARFAMVGGRVGFETLKFPDVSKGSGLFPSQAGSVLGFYNRRISTTGYLGVIYEGARVVTSQRKTTTQTQTLSFFYTLLSTRRLTLSLAAGPQYLSFSAPDSLPYQKWTPSVRASLGWVTPHFRLTSDYSKDITAGQGLLGAYASDRADASLGFHLTRAWSFNSIAVYQNNKNSVPTAVQGYPGGHTASGTASAEYSLGQHMTAGLGYTRLHQNYSGIAAISLAPESDRVFVSVTYDFRRPLGR
jgi:hypothetical protein